MLIPKYLHGTSAAVRARAERRVACALAGDAFFDAHDELLDTRTTSGRLVIDGPSPLIRGADFQCYAPFTSAASLKSTSDPSVRKLVASALAVDWALLGLCGQIGQGLVKPDAYVDFLLACKRSWSVFRDEGDRYAGPDEGSLWDVCVTPKMVLAQCGIPDRLLNGPDCFERIVDAAIEERRSQSR